MTNNVKQSKAELTDEKERAIAVAVTLHRLCARQEAEIARLRRELADALITPRWTMQLDERE
jgi:hypothetical protein